MQYLVEYRKRRGTGHHWPRRHSGPGSGNGRTRSAPPDRLEGDAAVRALAMGLRSWDSAFRRFVLQVLQKRPEAEPSVGSGRPPRMPTRGSQPRPEAPCTRCARTGNVWPLSTARSLIRFSVSFRPAAFVVSWGGVPRSHQAGRGSLVGGPAGRRCGGSVGRLLPQGEDAVPATGLSLFGVPTIPLPGTTAPPARGLGPRSASTRGSPVWKACPSRVARLTCEP